MTNKERLIVALDVDTEEKALSLVNKLKKDVRVFKVGSELFTSCGPGIVRRIKEAGCEVFLDLKFHDIPNTVAKSSVSAVRLGAFLFNVHASGGPDMMKKCAQAASDEAKALKIPRPKVIAVTVLTSMDENNLKKVGVGDNMEAQVLRLAKLAKESTLDGVVASAAEIKPIRKAIGRDFVIVTPGVRPSWAAVNDPSTGSGSALSLPKDDQKRIATPKEAMDSGADFIVVGRPIIEAPDPAEAARKVLKEIE